jgi:adenosine deaminase
MIDDRTLAQGVDPTAFVEGLARYVANRRVCLEVCLTSNRQTMPHLQEDLTKHAFKTMLEHVCCLKTCFRAMIYLWRPYRGLACV